MCVCWGERASKKKGRERQEEIDKQSESKGVAQSDKLNLMNELSSKK